jgi:tRNA modification GTPase
VVSSRTSIPDLQDTIVALSSAAGPGGRAVVRLSGRRAFAIAAGLSSDLDAQRAGSGRLVSGQLRIPGVHGAVDADIYPMRAPRTYTGDDVVEIHLLSCTPIVDALIAACLDAGVRAAQPGEFTLRAFLRGKLDLTRVEAVLGVIEATKQDDLGTALAQLAGGLSEPLHALRDDLLNLLADIEAGLDFADEDIRFVATDDMLKRLGHALAHVTLLKRKLEQRALRQRTFRVVLAGKPNAGKSSLLNALVGKDAALVSAEAGTTRDYNECLLHVNEVSLALVDTAGRRQADNAIESAAQVLGAEQARHADLILWCTPCNEPEPMDAALQGALPVATKADLGPAPAGVLSASVITGAGLAELRARLAEEARRAAHAALAPSVSRCRHHVEACVHHLQNAHANVIDEGAPDLLALEIRLALEELGAMVGAVYTDDLLDRIFSRFCIGK